MKERKMGKTMMDGARWSHKLGHSIWETGMEKSGSTGRRVLMAMTRQEQSSLARSTLHCLDLDMNLRFRIKK